MGSGSIFLLKKAVLGLGLRLRVIRVGVTVGVMVKGMLRLGLMSTLTLDLKQHSLKKAKR